MVKAIQELEVEEQHKALVTCVIPFLNDLNYFLDVNSQQKKKSNQKKLLDEIFDANQNAILVKQKRGYEEKVEEEKIVKYNLEKA